MCLFSKKIYIFFNIYIYIYIKKIRIGSIGKE